VLSQGDRVRFRFSTNFDGYLYVMNRGTSGKYDQLFPRQETGQDNRVTAGMEYQVPASASAFRIEGPAGQEIVYWLIVPARLTDLPPRVAPPAGRPSRPLTLMPRCDSAVLQTRGECIDTSAGPKLVPRGEELPQNLAAVAGKVPRDLIFMRQQDKSVIESAEPLTGPVLYEFRVAHR
jgi:hypothetical protein